VSDGFVTMSDGCKLWFQRHGSGGETVIVPNGLFYATDWQRLATNRTVVFYDVRNRGQSDATNDPAALARGIHADVEDLDAVRLHFGAEKIVVMAHSYVGVIALTYAGQHPAHIAGVIAVGTSPPLASKVYPPELAWSDEVSGTVMAAVAAFQKAPPTEDPEERCRAFWSILRPLYVWDRSYADKLDWGRCDLPNERAAFGYVHRYVFPSMQSLEFTAADFSALNAPVLLIHGRYDRSAPFGGALDWAALLPKARVMAVETGHAPWIEQPDSFFEAVEQFLDGHCSGRLVRNPGA
jgi:proline iminopeptidase